MRFVEIEGPSLASPTYHDGRLRYRKLEGEQNNRPFFFFFFFSHFPTSGFHACISSPTRTGRVSVSAALSDVNLARVGSPI